MNGAGPACSDRRLHAILRCDERNGRPLMLRVFATLLLASAALPAFAADVVLKPHRAVYSLKMTSGGSAGAAQGAMIFELGEACEGWTIQQRARFDMYGSDGDPVRHDIGFSSWESKSGTEYRFDQRTLQDDEVTEEMRGGVRLDQLGGEGKITYAKPEPKVDSLPAATMFPVAHTRLLLEQAMAGNRVVLRQLFSGQRDDEPMTVNAIIGDATARRDAVADGKFGKAAAPLLAGRAWRFHLAYFTSGEDSTESSTPAFELRETTNEQGVVLSAEIVFPEFTFSYTLERLEPRPAPRC